MLGVDNSGAVRDAVNVSRHNAFVAIDVAQPIVDVSLARARRVRLEPAVSAAALSFGICNCVVLLMDFSEKCYVAGCVWCLCHRARLCARL